MTWKKFIKEIGGFFVGDTMESVFSSVKGKVEETLEETQRRIEVITKNVIKTLTVFLICAIGLIFALVGFSTYLTETVSSLNHGLGFLAVGGVLVLLGLIIKSLR